MVVTKSVAATETGLVTGSIACRFCADMSPFRSLSHHSLATCTALHSGTVPLRTAFLFDRHQQALRHSHPIHSLLLRLPLSLHCTGRFVRPSECRERPADARLLSRLVRFRRFILPPSAALGAERDVFAAGYDRVRVIRGFTAFCGVLYLSCVARGFETDLRLRELSTSYSHGRKPDNCTTAVGSCLRARSLLIR